MQKQEPTIACHFQIDMRLHRRLKQYLLREADRRGVVRVTLAHLVREALERAVARTEEGGHG